MLTILLTALPVAAFVWFACGRVDHMLRNTSEHLPGEDSNGSRLDDVRLSTVINDPLHAFGVRRD